jgi:hypothetical protein
MDSLIHGSESENKQHQAARAREGLVAASYDGLLKKHPTQPSMLTTENMLAAGALLGSAALFIASKGRNSQALVKGAEEAGLGRLTPLSASVKQETTALMMAADKGAELPQAAQTAQHSALDFVARSRALAAQDLALDAPVRELTAQKQAELAARGEVLTHPITGQALDSKHTMMSLYVDSLPRKSTLEFAANGHLVPGIYHMSLGEFKGQFGGNAKRAELMSEFERALKALSDAGVKEVHVGGSFVTKRDLPNDIDFAWNKHEQPFNAAVLQQFEQGALLQHNSGALRSMGLQMLNTPPEGGTYKGLQYFLAHGHAEWEARLRGPWGFSGTTIPKGFVAISS